MILALKTSADPAEIYLLSDGKVINQKVWLAGRTLARDLLAEIEKLVGDLATLSGIVIFKGPGSFTGLRIGITTANTLAYSLNVPIVGSVGKNWRTDGLKKLDDKQNDKIVLPEYGALPHITKPKK
jgi:tRNA threonylcarbamoyladenosine biosynthesis protein TsaB